jgi:hypothetical protein
MPASLDGTSINPRLQIVSSTLGSRSKRTWIARRTSATVSMPVIRKVSREKVPTPISQSMKTNKISSAGIHAKIARILEFLRIWNTLRRLITSEVSVVGISSLGGEDVFLLMATFIVGGIRQSSINQRNESGPGKQRQRPKGIFNASPLRYCTPRESILVDGPLADCAASLWDWEPSPKCNEGDCNRPDMHANKERRGLRRAGSALTFAHMSLRAYVAKQLPLVTGDCLIHHELFFYR